MWKRLFPFFFLICITGLFFYKTVLHGLIPFPGDLLLSGYSPWKYESYNGYVAGAIPSKDQYFDVIRELYPWKTIVTRALKSGVIPLWNPYSFSGAPLLANYQSQVLYPLSLIYLILPQTIAWTILVIIQPLLGSLFIYLFATEIGLGMMGALSSAVLFNYSSFASIWMEFNTVWHTILWLPLLLYLFEKSVKKCVFTLSDKILFVFALFCSITAGHPQDFINSFLFLLTYILIRLITLQTVSAREKMTFVWKQLLILLCIPFLFAAPQLLPTIELFKNSARVNHDYQLIIKTMLIQWWQFPLFLTQDFFGNPATKTNVIGDYVNKALSIGATGLFLALVAVTKIKRNYFVTFFSIVFLCLVFLLTRSPLTQLLYRIPIPILSTGTPTRITFLLLFSLSMLAGFGMDYVIKQKRTPVLPIILFCFLFFLIILAAFFYPRIPTLALPITAAAVMKKAVLFSGFFVVTIIGFVLARRLFRLSVYGLFILIVIELCYAFLKFNPFVPVTFVYPKNSLIEFIQKQNGIDRYWGYGTAQIEANFASQTFTYSTDGTDPMNLKWYNEFLQSSKDGNIAKLFNRTTRSDTQLAPGYGKDDLPNNQFRLRIMDFLGVRYIVNRTENPISEITFPIDRFSLIWQKDGWTVFENKKALPRYFLTTKTAFYENRTSFERMFFDPLFDLHTILLPKEEWEQPAVLSGTKHNIMLVHYAPNELSFKTETDGTQLLFLSDTYDNGWNGYIDGKPIRIHKVNWSFRGIIVPEGDHIIILRYEPTSFTYGVMTLSISLMGSAVFILIALFNKQKRQKQKTNGSQG